MHVTGKCLCGAIEYEVVQAPLDAAYCHCRQCTLWTGAPVVAWATAPRSAFRLTQGTLKYCQASSKAQRGFCGDCGTAITFEYVPESNTIDFTLASLKDPAQIAPRYHIWTQSQIPWFQTSDKLPHYSDSGPDTWT
ncbi:GFA family protein [bacterium]|nr:GFA family protein [bacterium]